MNKKQLSERDICTKFITLCDRLEAQLETTHTESRRLLEAVLHDALAAG